MYVIILKTYFEGKYLVYIINRAEGLVALKKTLNMQVNALKNPIICT